MIVWK